MKTRQQLLRAQWERAFAPLIGRRIVDVRWMSEKERDNCGWERSPVVITLDDDTLLYPQSDEEGNDAGALAVQTGTATQGVPEIAGVI